MSDLVTFVFTDLVGSVDLKRRMPGAGAAERDRAYVERVLTPHRELIERGLGEARGRVVSTAGDGHFLAFADTIQAARWAIEVQKLHSVEPLAGADPAPQVRIGMHVGVPQIDPADSHNFVGRAVDYAARLADRAEAGQVLASRSVASLLEDAGLDKLSLHTHGKLDLRGIGEVEVHELLYEGRSPARPRRDRGDVDQREWTVLPLTMGLTEYTARSGEAPPKKALAERSGASSSVASTAAPVQRVGNYELLEIIGAGGMGNVYRARHALFGRTRAVKIIKPELVAAGGESVVQRFYQEVQATGALEHPNLVVAIESSSPEDDLHFLVMEYVDGLGVDQLIAEEGALPPAAACEIIRQAALGLEHLHSRGLVHRDVKPSNVMLTCVGNPSGGSSTPAAPGRVAVAKLMDLGLALLVRDDQQRLTRMDHGGMGTGHYMSPEQWRTTTVDIRADIYSLGCTLFHLLHGRPPYVDSDLRPEKAHQREPLPALRSDLPEDLAGLVTEMMAKKPGDRPQRPIDVAERLGNHAAGHGLVALIDRTHKTVRKSPYDTLGSEQVGIDTHLPRRIDFPHRPKELGAQQASPGAPERASRRHVLATTALAAGSAAAGLGWWASHLYDKNLAQRRAKLDSDARFAAKLMAAQIKERFQALESLASQSDLRGWLSRASSLPSEEASWEPIQNWLLEEKSQRDLSFKSSSWFLTDERGVQVARAPFSETIGHSYAHRDYFHGLGRLYDQASAEIPEPITTQHQSTVYESSTTHKLKVAYSAPVWDKRKGSDRRVIGVLAMSVTLGEFTALADAERAASPNEIILADTRYDDVEQTWTRGLLLHHQLLDAGGSAAHPRLDERALEQIDTKSRIDGPRLLTPYADFLGRDTKYRGAYAPIVITTPSRIDTGWIILAQEPA